MGRVFVITFPINSTNMRFIKDNMKTIAYKYNFLNANKYFEVLCKLISFSWRFILLKTIYRELLIPQLIVG